MDQQRKQQQQALQSAIKSREADFALAAWEAGLRSDSRRFLQLRTCTFTFPTAERGVCRVVLGETQVIASVTCKLVDPAPFSPKHGFLDFAVHANASIADAGAQSLAAASRSASTIEISKILDALFKASKAVDTEGLCVLPGRKVWGVAVDVLVLNDAGSAVDAAVWAAAGALMNFRRPELTIVNDVVTVHPPHERDPVPLNIHHVPLCVSSVLTGAPGAPSTQFGAFVVDPLPAEVVAGSGSVLVALSRELQLCALHKGDGEDVSYATLKQCIAAAKTLVPQLFTLIDAACAADEQQRKARALAQFSWAQTRFGVGTAPQKEQQQQQQGQQQGQEAAMGVSAASDLNVDGRPLKRDRLEQ